MKWFLKLLLSALAVFLLANILPGVVVESYMYAIWVAVIIGVLNAFLRPVLIFFTLPATLVTLGLFLFVINACIILIASNILEGSQASVHYLNYPLVDMDISYYYGVVCVDASGNESEISTSGTSITNTARGIPTISLDVPSNFMADGDLSEWFDSGIMPFNINPETVRKYKRKVIYKLLYLKNNFLEY